MGNPVLEPGLRCSSIAYSQMPRMSVACFTFCPDCARFLRLFGRQRGRAFRQRRQTIQAFQAEVLQELNGGAVLIRPARLFQAAHRLNQLAGDEGAEDAVAADPADRFDFGAGQRLAVGDDGQRLQGRLRQLGAEVQPQETLDVRRGLGRGGQVDPIALAEYAQPAVALT